MKLNFVLVLEAYSLVIEIFVLYSCLYLRPNYSRLCLRP